MIMKKITLSDIKNMQPRRVHREIEELADNIAKLGVIEPIIINQHDELIAGRRRCEAFQKLGIQEVDTVVIETKNDLHKLALAYAENIFRQAESWQVEIKGIEIIDEYLTSLAGRRVKERERTDLTGADSAPVHTTKKIDKIDLTAAPGAAVHTTKETAKAVGKAERTIQVSLQLAKALKEYPELEKVKTKKGALVELHKIKDKEKIKTLKSIEGLYDVIVIDPPWEGIYSPTGRRGGAKYPTMSIEQISNIKLPMANDCVVWLWTINKYLHQAFHILESWELEYKNTFTWVKNQLGLGDWGRTQTEHILLATKGKPIVDFCNQRNVIIADRKGHSEKPDDFFQIVEETCFGKKKLDYFARKERKEGWSVYGTLEE